MPVLVLSANATSPTIFQQMDLNLIPVIKPGQPQTFTMGDALDTDCPQRQVTLTRPIDVVHRPLTRLDVATILAREPQAKQVLLGLDVNTGREHVMGIQREGAGEIENLVPYGLDAPWGPKGIAATRLHDVTEFMRAFQGGREMVDPDHIARGISKSDARFLAALLAMAAGQEVRLPFEAEWEFVAQGAKLQRGVDQGAKGPGSIDLYPKDSRGFQALLGAVWQWCEDWYGPYPEGVLTDPTGPLTGGAGVLRGGAWYSDDRNSRASYRYFLHPDYRFHGSGVRLVVPRT
ncbi:MAG: SUMF1/EgtB/PvdO family nonheme iron enzyme [Deltaproteobacteria bacterium]|nr:SUMF1/EgtB/PvdO family nonheme iron enzyme [Deltaproteobacteria bacterium]